MAITWVVFVVAVAFFTYRGYRQGIWRAATRFVSLVLGYVAALWFTPAIVPQIERFTLFEGLAAYIVGGFGILFFVSMIIDFIFSLLVKTTKRDEPSGVSAMLGGGVGFCIGAVMGLAIVFCISYITDILPNEKQPNTAGNPTAIERVARAAAANLMSAFTKALDLQPMAGELSAALMREPGRVVDNIKAIQNNEQVQVLFQDPANQTALRNGDSATIQSLPAFQTFVESPEVQDLMALSGLEDNTETRALLAEQSSDLWRRAELVKDDPRIQEILSDPALQEQLKDGDPMALLNNAKMMEVVNILFSTELPPAPAINQSTTQSTPQSTSQSTSPPLPNAPRVKSTSDVQQWVDENGVTHFGERKAQ